jgi:AraC-like DNA-binding protein
MPTSESLAELIELLTACAPTDGIHPTAVPGLEAIRAGAPGEEYAHALHHPAMCLVVQGAKCVMFQGQAYEYDPRRVMVFSVDLPISATVTRATPRLPYLCLRMAIDAREVADLLAGLPASPAERNDDRSGLFVTAATAELLDASTRLLRLVRTPGDIAVMAPLVRREILFRLLQGTEGHRLAQIGRGDSPTGRVMQAIGWIKTHFDQPLRIDALARHVHMSESSLHHQFKAVTAMSPLQYQKQLRLQEARRLMLSGLDAASAGHAVGYESASQFSREYGRQFGAPPARDAQRLRELQPA